jgi:hypothetical protein
MAFSTARAKYAFGYGSFVLSYVRAALHRARYPSPSKSGWYSERCQPGRFCKKYLERMETNGWYSTTSRCFVFDSFDLFVMPIQSNLMLF